MRVITVQQPWAWAIFNGKNVENRSKNLAGTYRGPLAIHAGKRWSDRGGEHPLVTEAAWGAYDENEGGPRPTAQKYGPDFLLPEDFEVGVILGVVDLVDVHKDADDCCGSDWAESSYVEHGGTVRHDIWHHVLESPVLFDTPVPAVGGLGMRTIKDLDQLASINAQLVA